jgi:hypothetical protein
MFVGRWGAGFVLLLVIGATFLGGWALTDFSCVDPRTYQLEFVAHGLIGGPTALAMVTREMQLDRMPPWLEIGRLYVVVAGFLNLVALCDALGECWRRNARIHALRARLSARSSRPTWDDAAFPSLAALVPGAEPLPAFPTPAAPSSFAAPESSPPGSAPLGAVSLGAVSLEAVPPEEGPPDAVPPDAGRLGAVPPEGVPARDLLTHDGAALDLQPPTETEPPPGSTP